MIFCCPICKEQLTQNTNSYQCCNHHTFDLARQGYINLLRANNHIEHGDQKEMILSRRKFLECGYYDLFADKLCEIASQYISNKEDCILDCGCGEGYYTAKMKHAFFEQTVAGFDLSKKAISLAASKYKDIDFAVASSKEIPVPDQIVKILTIIFSPMETHEFVRILKKNGILIYAVPGARHLWELKNKIYDTPYENLVKDTEYKGLTLLKRIPVQSKITLTTASLLDLFTMTPYYFRSPAGTIQKLKNIENLETEIAFDFLVYRKTEL